MNKVIGWTFGAFTVSDERRQDSAGVRMSWKYAFLKLLAGLALLLGSTEIASAKPDCTDWMQRNVCEFFGSISSDFWDKPLRQDVEDCLARGANPNELDERRFGGQSDLDRPLHCAAKGQAPPAVYDVLLRAGADPGKKNRDGLLPFDIAFPYSYCKFAVLQDKVEQMSPDYRRSCGEIRNIRRWPEVYSRLVEPAIEAYSEQFNATAPHKLLRIACQRYDIVDEDYRGRFAIFDQLSVRELSPFQARGGYYAPDGRTPYFRIVDGSDLQYRIEIPGENRDHNWLDVTMYFSAEMRVRVYSAPESYESYLPKKNIDIKAIQDLIDHRLSDVDTWEDSGNKIEWHGVIESAGPFMGYLMTFHSGGSGEVLFYPASFFEAREDFEPLPDGVFYETSGSFGGYSMLSNMHCVPILLPGK